MNVPHSISYSSLSTLLPNPFFGGRGVLRIAQGHSISKLHIAGAGVKPMILLSQPPKYWDYRYMPPYLASYDFFLLFVCLFCFVFVVLEFEPRGILPLSYTPALFSFFFFVVLGIEPRGILPLSYTPRLILFLIWKQGLTRLLKASLNC